MGLLSRFAGLSPAKAPSDDVLLLHSMFLMAFADGAYDDEEFAVVCSAANALPEFKHTDAQEFNALVAQAKKILSKYDSPQAAVAALGQISTPRKKQKAFLLAVEVALASGDVDEEEDALLEAMQRVLGLNNDTAQSIINIMALKYAAEN